MAEMTDETRPFVVRGTKTFRVYGNKIVLKNELLHLVFHDSELLTRIPIDGMYICLHRESRLPNKFYCRSPVAKYLVHIPIYGFSGKTKRFYTQSPTLKYPTIEFFSSFNSI